MSLSSPPSLVEFDQMRFLIFDAPSDSNLHVYVKEFDKYNVTDIARLSAPTYDAQSLEKYGIKVHEMPFADGEPPPETIVESWIKLYEGRFYVWLRGSNTGINPCVQKKEEANNNTDSSPRKEKKSTIGVHCVAGLGRAPVLVAIALIEKGMAPLDAVEFIRKKRRGALNNKQLRYLETYRPHTGKGCVIM